MALLLVAGRVAGDEYPARPIKRLVAFSPGGGLDTAAGCPTRADRSS